MANIKGIIVEIGGDTSKLQNALKKVNSSTASLSKELRGINSLLKLDPKNTELLSQKQTVLKKNIEETEEKIKSLREAQQRYIDSGGDLNSAEYRNLQREIINTENKLKQLKLEASKWTQAGRSIEEFGNKVTNISNKIDKMGTTITTRLTLPILGLATAAVNSAKEFESAFTGVEKTVDGTAEQMANLKQGIKDMSEELPSSTTEIAAVAEAAGQLGIQTDNVLGFSKAMIDLGNSTNLTADEAAQQLAKFANIMGMSQKDFDKLGSSIVDLGNNFATTEADIVNMAMRLAGAGKQVGFSEGQVLGLATALSSVGIEAEMGGSAISKAMVKMQNAVEMGGTKLDSVLKKTGMTLRDLELMSANDSKSFREMSQSIGMTSTEVKQLVTAGANLQDFASVSGMTAEKFKKAWKEDASGALSAFIKGLGDAENKGESAITMLSEMGLTEVRLRDSLLRAANAGNLFNNAIDTGTKAWNENVALTNEANKRYQTLESRMEMTKNKIKNVATNTGDKLTPAFNKMLDKVDGLIDKFDDLNDEETENVIKTLAIVAAIGPAIKILGTFGKGIGTATKGIGIFSQAVGVMKSGIDGDNKAVNKLAKGLTGLTSPLGLAITTTVALTAVTIAANKAINKDIDEQKKLNEEITKQSWNLKELEKQRQETLNGNLSEIENVQKLKNELSGLVDENGKVEEKYKGRVKFILEELNKALGTEYSMTGDVINQYGNLRDSIDKTIQMKKANIILNSKEEAYTEAVKNQASAIEKLNEIQKDLNNKKAEYAELDEKITKLQKER